VENTNTEFGKRTSSNVNLKMTQENSLRKMFTSKLDDEVQIPIADISFRHISKGSEVHPTFVDKVDGASRCILTSTIGKKSGDFLTHAYIPLYFTFRHTEKLCSYSCRRGETMSLKCGHQRAYRSSPR
jgi:hypothetical protein